MLARYRRPLLLGIGAILLAMMAMPMVKSLVGTETPPAQRITTGASADSSQPNLAPMQLPAMAIRPSHFRPPTRSIQQSRHRPTVCRRGR